MSPNKVLPEENSEILSEEELAALDRELAQLAQDTPEMPDDFHARWTEQVRAEAGQAQRKARTEKGRQWRYILSAAAVFVFLIGGTLLTRSRKTNDLTADYAAAPRMTAVPAAGMAAEDAGAAVMADMAAEEDFAEQEEEAPAPEANWISSLFTMKEDSAVYAGKAAESAYEAAGDMTEAAAPEEDAYAALEEAAEEPETAAAPEAAKSAANSVEFAGTAGSANSAAVPEATAAVTATAMPTAPATAAPTPEPAAQPVTEPAPEPAAEDSPFVSFLKDLGIFTLKTLGAALCCAVPVSAVLLIRRKRRKK